MKKSILLLTFSMLATLIACQSGQNAETKAPPQTPAKLVKVITVAPRMMTERLELPGTLQAENVANVLATAEGKISRLLVREGDAVSKDAVVVTISPLIREDIINSARLQVEAKKEALARQPEDPVLQKMLQQAEQDNRFALQQYREVPVTSPISGVISQRWIDLGDMVPAKQKLFEIQSSGRLRVETPVSELDLRKLQMGQSVQIDADACPEKIFHGQISRIHPQIDNQTRNGLVEVRLLDPCVNLRSGMFVRATFVLRQLENALAIPMEALIERPQAQTCFVVNDEQAHERTLQTGLVERGWVEIRSGLNAGELVVIEGQQQLKEGTQVKIQSEAKGGKTD
jgi:multidrug efflux pump subunit AcrA (membrane-fusion protein)